MLAAHRGPDRPSKKPTCPMSQESIGHFQRLFGITPEVVAHDLHPEYRSSRYALDLAGVQAVGINTTTRIAACLVDNNETGPA